MTDADAFLFDPLPRRHHRVVIIDPPWKWSGGTKSRPQHYPRMTWAEIEALPVRELLHPEGGRVFLWITAPLLNRIERLQRAWRLRYSSAFPWIKLWPGEDGMFVYRNSLSRGTGFEVLGNAEYIVILKAGRPQSIKGRPFPSVYHSARREHSRKPTDLHADIEQRLAGPYVEIFGRERRAGWDSWGNQVDHFNARPDLSPTAQAAGVAGASPGQGLDVERIGDGREYSANPVYARTSTAAGEAALTAIDPAAAADPRQITMWGVA